MTQQISSSIENNFTGGLKTEYTGLNFPENACTDTDNCVFSLVGDVSRRAGIDFETGYTTAGIDSTGRAINTYKWNNVAGDGETKMLVLQVGETLYFYQSTNATEANPLSTSKLATTVSLSAFQVAGAPDVKTVECQFTDGNGYLFVFHPYLTPFYCTFAFAAVTATAINVQVRDFRGIVEPGVATQTRSTALSSEHNYNLLNQGWSSSPSWYTTSSSSHSMTTGSKVFVVAPGMPVSLGQNVQVTTPGGGGSTLLMAGTATAYAGTNLTINVTSVNGTGGPFTNWTIQPINAGLINTWHTSQGNYPSNADTWWRFKNASGVFDPSIQGNITLGSGPARSGYYILDAFSQNRSATSSLSGLTSVSTVVRPKTGTWFQGRVWYAGVDASQPAGGDAQYYTWSENIYFSQTVENNSQFGMCYQTNDPTSEDFFDLLPTDGGVIQIQGCGSVYKLFPIQNGLLVFAANGVWFITGSQGIGFSASDYTITKISSVQTVSSTSFIDILGFPLFWNEEGIYSVSPSDKGGGLVVTNLCYGTILSFYSEIPSISKKYVRGDYNPISFVVSWAYRGTSEVGISDRYNFDKVMNFNTANKAFYPYSLTVSTDVNAPFIHDIKYINNPGGSALSAPSDFKYLTSFTIPFVGIKFTFSEEHDETNWVDFKSYNSIGIDYESFFITGFKLKGQAIRKFQPIYLQAFSSGLTPTQYKIQGIWDYAISGNSGKFSSSQLIQNTITSNYSVIYRRHKIRGHGLALQFKISSVTGAPFSIIGWTSMEAQNSGM